MGAALFAGSLALPACTAARRGEMPRPMAQGGSWELVLPTQAVADVREQTPLDELPEYARRDLALAARTPRAPTALDTWPSSQPSLISSYYLNIPNRAEDVLIVPPYETFVPPVIVVPPYGQPPYGRYPTYPPPSHRYGHWR